MTIQEMREARAKLVADARKLIDDAEKREDKKMTVEENAKFDKIMADVDSAKTDIEKREKLETTEADLKTSVGRRTAPEKPGSGQRAEEAIKVEFRGKPIEFQPGTPGYRLASPEYRSRFGQFLAHGSQGMSSEEYRDLQTDIDTAAGYLAMPVQMVSELLKFVDNQVFVRNKGRVFQVPMAQALGVVSLDTDVADSDWTAEIATGSADSSMAVGKRELHPHPLAKRIKVSNKLMRSAIMGPEAIVNDRLGYKVSVTEEKAFMTGTGAQQPLGMFTASSNGVDTSRDVSTGNSTTAISADGLINAFYALKPQYQSRAEGIFHRDAISQIRKLKDGNGQYLWLPGINGGTADTILGRPYNQSEYAPNTFTTGLYVGMFADLQFYWIAEALNMQIQRLSELYAETNQTGFIVRAEVDGAPVLAEAFSRVKLG